MTEIRLDRMHKPRAFSYFPHSRRGVGPYGPEAASNFRIPDTLCHSLLRMQMPREILLAVRFGVQHIVFLKGLQLMQQKHQHDADQKRNEG